MMFTDSHSTYFLDTPVLAGRQEARAALIRHRSWAPDLGRQLQE